MAISDTEHQVNRRNAEGRTNIIEGTAISASLLCLAHCLALPVLLLLLPGALGLFAQSEAFHFAALALVVPAALAAFWLGYQRHRAAAPAALGAAGAACLAGALWHAPAENVETLLTVREPTAGHRACDQLAAPTPRLLRQTPNPAAFGTWCRNGAGANCQVHSRSLHRRLDA